MKLANLNRWNMCFGETVRELDSSMSLSVVRVTIGLVSSSGYVTQFHTDGPAGIESSEGVTLQIYTSPFRCWIVRLTQLFK